VVREERIELDELLVVDTVERWFRVLLDLVVDQRFGRLHRCFVKYLSNGYIPFSRFLEESPLGDISDVLTRKLVTVREAILTMLKSAPCAANFG